MRCPGPPVSPPSPGEKLARIRAYLHANIHNPAIQPRHVAAATQVSVRHLHRLFAQMGMPMGAWVRGERLRRCAADMRDPARPGRTITDIAFAWGFNDSAHFSRCFRERYGMTPRRYRAALGNNPNIEEA
jgi:AraC family transcriptional activator of tynA and feaB